MDFILENSLLLLLSLGTGFTVWWLLRHREALAIRPVWALVLGITHTLVGVACVKIFAVLESLDLSSAGSMSLFGAIFFLPMLYWGSAKLTGRKAAVIFDVFTPCVVFVLLCARINCILSGCCLGRVLPWGGLLRWPTRELEILFYFVLLFYLFQEEGKDTIPGSLYPVYMVVYGLFRFVAEGFRESSSASIIHISHIWAALTFCIGLSIYVELRNKNTKRRKS